MGAIGKNLRRLRTDAELSTYQLAEAIGVSPQTVTAWERGSKEPRMGHVQTLASYFRVSVDELLSEQQSIPSAYQIIDLGALLDDLQLRLTINGRVLDYPAKQRLKRDIETAVADD